jgi:uncharacterized membrane protein YgcG
VGRKAGWHAVNDTGSMTGVATAILALLSAGTVASITLVGVHQLAPAVSERLHAGEPAAVRAPVTVVVTPRAPAAAPGSENTVQRSASKPRTPKPRLSSPSDATVVPAVLTSPASPVSTRSPRVTLPPVHVHRSAVTIPAVTVPAVTVPAVTVPAVTIPAVIALAVTVPAVPTLLAVVPVAPTFTVGPPVSVLPQPGFPQGSSSGHGHGGPDGSGSGHDGDGSGHDGGGSGHDGDGSGHDGDGSGHDGDGH